VTQWRLQAFKWYYYQYSSSSERSPSATASSKPTNPLASLFAYGGAVRREPVVLVKSGPGDMGDGQMDLEELVNTILWYGKVRSPSPFNKKPSSSRRIEICSLSLSLSLCVPFSREIVG